jgi:hypothetical protein
LAATRHYSLREGASLLIGSGIAAPLIAAIDKSDNNIVALPYASNRDR